jgi:hypothetical protein
VAAGVLGQLGVTFEAALAQVRRLGRTREPLAGGPRWPLVATTPGAVRVPELARQQAEQNGSGGRVGTQHYLLRRSWSRGVGPLRRSRRSGVSYPALKERLAALADVPSSDGSWLA